MVSRYCFWYCIYHDCGGIVVYNDDDDGIFEKCNICGVEDYRCTFKSKGVLEYDNNNKKFIELAEVQLDYTAEGGGWKWKMYLDSMFDILGNELHSTEQKNLLLEWYHSK